MTTEVKSEIHSSNGVTLEHRRIGHSKLRLKLPRYVSEERTNEVRKAILVDIRNVCRARPLHGQNNIDENALMVNMRFRGARVSPEMLIEQILESATTKIAAMKSSHQSVSNNAPHSRRKDRFVKKPKSALAA